MAWLAYRPPWPGKQSVPPRRAGRVIQRIMRRANVSTTATYYIKTAAAGVIRMTKLESSIPGAPCAGNSAGGFDIQGTNLCSGRAHLEYFDCMIQWKWNLNSIPELLACASLPLVGNQRAKMIISVGKRRHLNLGRFERSSIPE